MPGFAWKDDEEEGSTAQWSGELGMLDEDWRRRLGLDLPRYRRAETDYPDQLDPTDIYGMATGLLGLKIKPIGWPEHPELLAMYVPDLKEVLVDWTLFTASYSTVCTDAGWQRVIDTSWTARWLVAWLVATHMIGDLDKPLHIKFVPKHQPMDKPELRRICATWEMVSNLMCPEPRLLSQVAGLGISPDTLGWPDWRQRIGLPPQLLVNVLASINRCLPILVELQLDRYNGLPALAHIFQRLYQEIPVFQLRAIKAGRLYARTAELGTESVTVRLTL